MVHTTLRCKVGCNLIKRKLRNKQRKAWKNKQDTTHSGDPEKPMHVTMDWSKLTLAEKLAVKNASKNDSDK